MLTEYKRGNGQGQAKEDWTYRYDELNRLVQAHETHGQYLRNYQYDSLGNLTYEWNDNNVKVDYKLNNLNQITTKSDDGWKTWTDYSYDKRGNTTRKVYYKNKKALTAGAYDYDESNRMVKGTNDIGEQSIYHFNGLGILATNEWIIKKNAYGYHDVTEAALTTVTAQDGAESEIILDVQNNKKQVKSKKPAEEVAVSPELNKTSHVIKDFVIDYNSDAEENLMEYERYDEGLTYRYVYGVDKLGVTAYTIPNGSASVTTDAGEIPLYYHMDHMGSSEFLTSDVTQRVTSWTSYDEWGNITHNAVLKCGTRELDLVKTYTGHERDSVLGMYYAKARMYDTADKHGSSKGNKLGDKRFTAVDPVKGNVRNPQSLVQYTYVLNNPLMYVDPLGQYYIVAENKGSYISYTAKPESSWQPIADAVFTTIEPTGFGLDAVSALNDAARGVVAGNSKTDLTYINIAKGGTLSAIMDTGKKTAPKIAKKLIPPIKAKMAIDTYNASYDVAKYDEIVFELLKLSNLYNSVANDLGFLVERIERAYKFVQDNEEYFFGRYYYTVNCGISETYWEVDLSLYKAREEKGVTAENKKIANYVKKYGQYLRNVGMNDFNQLEKARESLRMHLITRASNFSEILKEFKGYMNKGYWWGM